MTCCITNCIAAVEAALIRQLRVCIDPTGFLFYKTHRRPLALLHRLASGLLRKSYFNNV